jgi:transposase
MFRLVKRLVARELNLSFVPDAEQRLWRTVVRRKLQLTRNRVRLQNRVESLLEEAHIKSCDFFLAEDRWKAMAPFRIGALGNAPTFFERLAVKEPQGCQTDRDAARQQLALLE